MKELLCTSYYFGLLISIITYAVGVIAKKKFKSGIFNPLLISIVLTIIILLILGIDYDSYKQSANILSYLLTPATICLAIPLYEQITLLKKNFMAIIAGILSGVITSLGSILAMSVMFGLSHEYYVTMLPKSVTTAIGMGIAEELGGSGTISAAVIIVTGVLGNIIGSAVCSIFRITEPVAKGIALGTSAHAVGTARAMEMGDTEGAMSSLSIAVAGLITVVGASLFAQFL